MDFDRLNSAVLNRNPFDYVYVPALLTSAELDAIAQDFPATQGPGSFDAAILRSGPAFRDLLDSMHSDAFRILFENKFGVDLSACPLHITVRGQVRSRDGSIHTDSKEKILTGLLYLNREWSEAGGRLRLLRNSDDIEDYAVEVAPVNGNLIVFRRCDHSWHGHLPSEGRRLSLQFNWVTGRGYVRRELARHRLSGWLKRLTG